MTGSVYEGRTPKNWAEYIDRLSAINDARTVETHDPETNTTHYRHYYPGDEGYDTCSENRDSAVRDEGKS